MNFRDFWKLVSTKAVGVVLAGGLLVGCKAKEADGHGAGREEKSEQEVVLVGTKVLSGGGVAAVVPQEEVPEPVQPKWSREDAGFARYLPEDTEVYVEARKLEFVWDLFRDLKTEEAVERLKLDEISEATGEDAETVEEWKRRVERDFEKIVRPLFGREVFFAARGLEWWMQPYAHYQEVVYPKMLQKMVKRAADGNFFMGGDEEQAAELVGELMAFMKGRMDAAGGKPVLSMQFGGRVDENRKEVLAGVRGWLEFALQEGRPFVKHEFTREGVRWEGVKLEWDSMLEEASEGADLEVFGEAHWKELREMAEGLPLVVACAEVGSYVVISIGLGEQSVVTAASAEQSLAARKAFDFLREYEQGTVLGMGWLEEELTGTLHKLQSWVPVWKGVAAGLDESKRLGTGPLMAKSIREIARLSGEKRAGKAHDLVGALILKDGLHLEVRGGWQGEMLDLSTPLKFAAALDQWEGQPFLRAHWKERASYGEMSVQQFKEAMNVVGLIGREISEAMDAGAEELEDGAEEDEDGDGVPEAVRERRLAELMRQDFLKAMENLWTGYRDHFRTALGEEAALLIDLQGEAPPIVGFEEETLKRGRIPRVAYMRPVKSRADLEATWELWRDAGVRLLGIFSEAVETPIPFPDTMSADTNDLRTHFIPMPFATDDFLPSLSVSDELFIVGSSKALAVRVDKAMREVKADRVGGSGLLMEVNMASWWDFCEAWLEVGMANRDQLKGLDPKAREEMDEPVEEEDELEDIDALLERGVRDADDVAGEEEKEAGWGALSALPFLDLEGIEDPGGLLRGWIGKVRWWKGMSYREWLEEGVPRSSTLIHWGDPAAAGSK